MFLLWLLHSDKCPQGMKCFKYDKLETSAPPLATSSELSLTCSLVHRQLIGQDAANLAEGGHLDAVLLQLALHVVDLLLCEEQRGRWNQLASRFTGQRSVRERRGRLAAHL